VSSTLSILIPRGDIEVAVTRLARQIGTDYAGCNLVAVGILKGAFIFMADLVRQVGVPLEVDFITVSSYAGGTETSRQVSVLQDLTVNVQDKDVLVVEDIVDSGHTVAYVMKRVAEHGARSVRLCALADKPSRRETRVDIDYLGFTVPNKFIVGYGLDFDNKFRYLPDICALDNHD
jgi:hypoxanthine phosphoribosyltransferase